MLHLLVCCPELPLSQSRQNQQAYLQPLLRPLKLKLSQVPANPVWLHPQPLFRPRFENPRSVLKGSMLQ